MTWGGSRATRLRAAIRARLPLPCTKCGVDVQRTDTWDVDHITARIDGGTDHPSNLGPAHASCNRSAGATAGNHRRSGRARRLLAW